MQRNEILQFMNANPTCYLATMENDQSRVRGMSMYRADEQGILFHTAAPPCSGPLTGTSCPRSSSGSRMRPDPVSARARRPLRRRRARPERAGAGRAIFWGCVSPREDPHITDMILVSFVRMTGCANMPCTLISPERICLSTVMPASSK